MNPLRSFRLWPMFGLALLSWRPASAQNALQPGDKVAICGDSITEQRRYSVLMEDYLLMCQPQSKLGAMQFGVGGETASGLLGRMKDDVLLFSPTVATTCYGMNDGGLGPLDPNRAAQYKTALTEVVKTFKKAGVRFIVVGSPGAVDTTTFKRAVSAEVYNQTLASLGDIAKQVATDQGVTFADLHSPMMEAMQKAKAKYGRDFQVAGGDGIHPDFDGHLVMAYAFLKALGCDGEIGTLTFDAKNGTATGSENHKILSASPTGFVVESSRYPFCFFGAPTSSSGTRSMVDLIPFNQDLNRFLLIVKNSPARRLKVTWGATSKEFTRDELEQGINLAAEFGDNPFSQPFARAESILKAQQDFEQPAAKFLRSLPGYNGMLPDEAATWARLKTATLEQSQKQRAASALAIVPVVHELKIETLPGIGQ